MRRKRKKEMTVDSDAGLKKRKPWFWGMGSPVYALLRSKHMALDLAIELGLALY